ncbi:unnamed protein product [Rotaria sordida]|uniref:DUF4704 domain-containing protein n=1 Tax=Rotaria sordida TaxID=392033 RepID=A0A813W0C9_9BILA|nr:unnamed protein product [Rotaria sordida]
MQSHNLFSLLTDRILLHPNSFTMVKYNVLFEITKEDYYRKVNKIVESMKDDDDNESKTSISPRKLSDSQTPVDEQTASTPINSLETILELTYLMNINENDDISTLIASFIKNLESVLQELDVQRLSAIFSRQASIISTTPKYSTWYE